MQGGCRYCIDNKFCRKFLKIETSRGVQGVLVFKINDISESQESDQRRGPKLAKISGGVKIQDFGPPLSAKKMLQTAQ